MKSILCVECDKQIKKKKELVVAGKLLQPYHKVCLDNPNSKFGKWNRFSGKVPTGINFWILILVGNYFISEMFRKNPDSMVALISFGIIYTFIFIGARIGTYLYYERYLE